MSVFIFQRLRSTGLLARGLLLEALVRSTRRKSAFVEELIRIDVSSASVLAQVVARDGEPADERWRPDSRLLMDLPPGICERYLSFPYRERAGRVEIVTVSPEDTAVAVEFEQHLRRGVSLYRGSLQALLAAAGAPVDLNALSRQLHQSVPAAGDASIPLVRKSQGKERYRERTPTAPGLGREELAPPHSPSPVVTAHPPSWVAKGAATEERLRDAYNLQELATALGAILPAPSLIFELRGGRLTLRHASGPGSYGRPGVSLVEESALSTAVEEGSYVGPWYSCLTHDKFATSFPAGTLVRVERIGSPDVGLVVAMVSSFDAKRAATIIDQAATTWHRVVEQV